MTLLEALRTAPTLQARARTAREIIRTFTDEQKKVREKLLKQSGNKGQSQFTDIIIQTAKTK